MPVSYKPRDSRMQKKDVTVPETDTTISNAVTHDKAWVPLAAVDKILTTLRLTYLTMLRQTATRGLPFGVSRLPYAKKLV